MKAVSTQTKAARGSVGIEVFRDKLRLRLPRQIFGGEQKYIYTGLENTPENWKKAQSKAWTIEEDIATEGFDPTLAKYKPQSHLFLIKPVEEPQKALTLSELWEQYTQFKKPLVSQSTYAVDYRKYRNHIASLPTRNLKDAIAIRDYLLAKLTPNAARRTLTNINACCDWALKSKLIDSNPFQSMASEIKLPKSNSDETDINPFSRDERNAIIQSFEESKFYKYYAPLVKFLFFNGCRPSEAIALQWKHVNDKFITFEQAITISSNGLALKNGLKTQAKRRFPINGQVRAILDLIEPENCKPDELLFKSKQGGFIDFGDFLNHAWKGYKNRHGKQIDGIVTQLIRQGIVSEYRRPYQCRHTFITLCLESNVDAKDVARWVGNSPEIIYRHYAGNKRDLQVPEL